MYTLNKWYNYCEIKYYVIGVIILNETQHLGFDPNSEKFNQLKKSLSTFSNSQYKLPAIVLQNSYQPMYSAMGKVLKNNSALITQQYAKSAGDFSKFANTGLIAKGFQDSLKKFDINHNALNKYFAQSVQPTSALSQIVNSNSAFFKSLKKLNRLNTPFYESFKEIREQAEKARPRMARLSSLLCENGWGISPSISMTEKFEILDQSLDVNAQMVQLYEQNNYQYLLSDLESLAYDLPEQLAEIPELMSKTFIAYKDSYKLMFAELFAILDYSYVRGSGNEFSADYHHRFTKYKNIVDDVKKLRVSIENDTNRANYQLFTFGVLQVIQNLFSNVNDITQPFEDNPYVRHTIEHGRYDMRKLELIDFYKLVNVCASYAMLSSIRLKNKN